MKNYEGVRKGMKEAGWSRHDRRGEEFWQRPGNDYLYSFDSAVARFERDKKRNGSK